MPKLKIDLPTTVRGWILLVGALGMAVSVTAMYINLPKRVAFAESQLSDLATIVERLTAIQEYQNQQANQPPRYPQQQQNYYDVYQMYDDYGNPYCEDSNGNWYWGYC